MYILYADGKALKVKSWDAKNERMFKCRSNKTFISKNSQMSKKPLYAGENFWFVVSEEKS